MSESDVSEDRSTEPTVLCPEEIFKDVDDASPALNDEETVENSPDGGWGWMVALGAAIGRFACLGILVKSMGLIYAAIQAMFPEAPHMLTAWIPALINSAIYLPSPLFGVLQTRFSPRLLTFCGGAILFFSLIWSSFAASAKELVFTLGVLSGFGAGLGTFYSVKMIGQYFNEKKAIAFGINYFGASLGAFTCPFIVDYLLKTYGMRGTLLISAGICSHGCLAAMLYRPLESKKYQCKEIPFENAVSNKKDEQRKKWSIHLPHVLKKPSFCVFVMNEAIFLFGGNNIHAFLPVHVGENGMSQLQASQLLSITAGADMVGRIFWGFFANKKIIKPWLLSSLFSAGCGIASLIIAYVERFQYFAILCPLYGFCFSGKPALRAVMLIDYFGKSDLNVTWSICSLAIGSSLLLPGPIIGALRDNTGSYLACYLFMGGSMLFSALLISIVFPICLKFERINKRTERSSFTELN